MHSIHSAYNFTAVLAEQYIYLYSSTVCVGCGKEKNDHYYIRNAPIIIIFIGFI